MDNQEYHTNALLQQLEEEKRYLQFNKVHLEHKMTLKKIKVNNLVSWQKAQNINNSMDAGQD